MFETLDKTKLFIEYQGLNPLSKSCLFCAMPQTNAKYIFSVSLRRICRALKSEYKDLSQYPYTEIESSTLYGVIFQENQIPDLVDNQAIYLVRDITLVASEIKQLVELGDAYPQYANKTVEEIEVEINNNYQNIKKRLDVVLEIDHSRYLSDEESFYREICQHIFK